MPRKEKFGKLVLLEETEATGLGGEYRAAKLGPTGIEKIVTILRLKAGISGSPEVARVLMDQAKVAAQLQNTNVLKILGIGKVEQTYYLSYEHVEGKSLGAILERCRQEAFPFSVEHALLVASKVASALEYAHGRRNDAGVRYFHGLLSPAYVVVSYEGEVRVKGFGVWPSRLYEAQLIPAEDLQHLAPEQAAGPGDPRSDVYALGAVLFETLTGPLAAGGDLASRIADARLASPTGDDDKIPEPLAEILRKSLAADPGARYSDMQEMRKAIDTLLFSGDFTPTTFNLAFFMHSLYREDIERESLALEEDKKASYAEFLPDEQARVPTPPAAPAAPAAPPPTSTKTEPVDPRLLAALKFPEPAAASTSALAQAYAATHVPAHEPAPAHSPHESSPGLTREAPGPSAKETPGVSAKEAASSFTFHKGDKKGSKTPLFAGLGLLAVIVGVAGWWFLLRSGPLGAPAAPPTSTLSPAAVAALDRVKELEDKLATLEREKAEAESKAADDAKKKVESQAAARGQQADPAAIQRATDEARKKAKEEQERHQQEELRKLTEQKKAEEDRLAAERKKAEDTARADQAAKAEQARLEAEKAAQVAAATPPPTTQPAAPPTTVATGTKAGTLVNLSDPGVTPPVAERAPPPLYPPIALRQRVEGVVELNVFVDEKGVVVDAQVVQGSGGRAGLNEAAIDSVKRRKYRPATKDGVPVKVWMSVRVKFELPH